MCASAVHSRLGDLAGASADAAAPELVADDVVTLDYSSRAGEGSGDDCLFVVTIPGAAGAAAARALTPATPAAAVTHAFEFRPVQPNPIRGLASLRFVLDAASEARVELFDAGGRRVRTIGGARLDAGAHEFAWDGRDAAGQRVRPGVFLARLIAASRRAEQKLVVLP